MLSSHMSWWEDSLLPLLCALAHDHSGPPAACASVEAVGCASSCRARCSELSFDHRVRCGACFADDYSCRLGEPSFESPATSWPTKEPVALAYGMISSGPPRRLVAGGLCRAAPPTSLVVPPGQHCVGNRTYELPASGGLVRVYLPDGTLAHRLVFDGVSPSQLVVGASSLILHGLRDDRVPTDQLEERATNAPLSLTCRFASEFVGAVLTRHASHLGVRTRLVRAFGSRRQPSDPPPQHWMLEVWGVYGARRWALVDIDHQLMPRDAASGEPLSALEFVLAAHVVTPRGYAIR